MLVAGARAADDLRQRHRLGALCLIEPLERRSRDHRLDATRSATVTGCRLVAHRVVAPLASDTMQPVENTSVHHDAAPNAGAKDQPDHYPSTSCRAEDGLCEREAVGVIREPGVHA